MKVDYSTPFLDAERREQLVGEINATANQFDLTDSQRIWVAEVVLGQAERLRGPGPHQLPNIAALCKVAKHRR